MTAAASNASAFFEEVARERRVFTILSQGELVVFERLEGEVVAWWSSRGRLERVRRDHSKYRAFEVHELSLNALVRKVLPQLQRRRIRVGVNWSGARLIGYEYSVTEVRRNLRYWAAR